MNILLKIKFILLVSCIIADTVLPLFLPFQETIVREIAAEKETEPEKTVGEEKIEADKILERNGVKFSVAASRQSQQFSEHDKLAKSLDSLPIHAPPPKLGA